jgi:hypothetical protein
VWRVARGQGIDKDELIAAAIAGGAAPAAARAIVESQAGRAALQRWASSEVAATTARVAQRTGRQLGAGAGPSLQTAITPPAPAQQAASFNPPAGQPPQSSQPSPSIGSAPL